MYAVFAILITGTQTMHRRLESEDDMATVIEGLKLTMTGKQVRERLEERIEYHQRQMAWWEHERTRTPEEQTEDAPLLPDHMCEHEAERHEWRAEVLMYIRDHIEELEHYRLGESDLEFGELLPDKPGAIEQDEYQERNRVGFQLEQLTKRVGELASSQWARAEGAEG
jgi:hypothetical protein